jgi:hypothetical protein
MMDSDPGPSIQQGNDCHTNNKSRGVATFDRRRIRDNVPPKFVNHPAHDEGDTPNISADAKEIDPVGD